MAVILILVPDGIPVTTKFPLLPVTTPAVPLMVVLAGTVNATEYVAKSGAH